MRVKVISARQAAALIQDGDHLILGGFIGSVVPEAIEQAIGQRFQQTQHPRDLSIYFAAGQGDGKTRSLNHLAEEGLLKFALGGHWGLVPKLQPLIIEEKIGGYNLPQGVISHLFRDSAAGKPGTLSHVGLGTFVDPRIEGGKINSKVDEDWVKLMEIDGKEYLFYKKIQANVAILRGTTADTNGNISMEDECLFTENLAAAQLVKNCGGKVIVQVKRLQSAGTLQPQMIRIPGILVDYVVVAEDQSLHMQTFAEAYNPGYCHCASSSTPETTSADNAPLSIKKIIARRCAQSLRQGAVLNLGIGLPEMISEVAREENINNQFILTVEPGAIGGTPAGGLSFGASLYPEAIITQDQQFDFYDGGGLDQAFLGLAECDKHGNLNVSRFGARIVGCGGFINITQNAKEVFFCGTFTAGKQHIECHHGELHIIQDGAINKFVDHVQQITFSGKTAVSNNKPVIYITERAVFKLTPQGMMLIEIAPGVDLQKDILKRMAFTPLIAEDVKIMDSAIFSDAPMGLAKSLLNKKPGEC